MKAHVLNGLSEAERKAILLAVTNAVTATTGDLCATLWEMRDQLKAAGPLGKKTVSEAFLVIGVSATGGGHWGRGPTPVEAAQAAIKAGAKRTERGVLYAFIGANANEVSMSSWGMVEWPSTATRTSIPFTKLGALITK